MSDFIKSKFPTVDPCECNRCKSNVHRWVIEERIVGNEFTMVVVYVCYDCGQQKVERV